MAYDAWITGVYSGRAGYDIAMYCRREAVDNPGNNSTYYWALYQRNLASNTPSYQLDARTWYTTVYNFSFSGSANCDFRGIGYGGSRMIGSGYTGWITHDAAGYLNVGFAASHATGYWGTASASGVLYTDRIPKVPGAPGAIQASMITPTSVRLYVPGTSENNGSTIDAYVIRFSVNANPDVAPYYDVVPNINTGVYDQGGLTPGMRYYTRGFARNAMGYGPGGPISSFQTLSGAYVGMNNIMQGVEVLVGSGGSFKTAEMYIGKDGEYVLAT